jgi:hypothetical protein
MATASGKATTFTNERLTTTGAKPNAVSVAITFTNLRP